MVLLQELGAVPLFYWLSDFFYWQLLVVPTKWKKFKQNPRNIFLKDLNPKISIWKMFDSPSDCDTREGL